MPDTELRPFVVMMPRLLAEQSRRAINEMLATNGRLLKDPDQRRFLTELDQTADGGQRDAPRKLSLDQLERAGMRVIRETVPAASPTSRIKPGQRPGLKPKGPPAAEEVSGRS